MTDLNTYDHLGHQRWLIDSGLINDLHKDTLFMYGSVVHKDVQAVHVMIRPEKKTVDYIIYLEAGLIKKNKKFCELKASTSVFGLWRFKRMLEIEGNLDLEFIADKFVKDYCGPKWKASVIIEDYKNYEEGLENEEAGNFGGSKESPKDDKSPD